jgi:flagellar basal-body rod protein FlgB
MPSLEAMVRFSGARQRIIAHNIANMDTPNFRPMDVSPQDFQAALGRAIDARRSATGEEGDLPLQSTQQMKVDEQGNMTLMPATPSGNILFHDRNNRDVEKLMADQAENAAVFRTSIELLRSRYGIIQAAISERV